MIFAALVLFVRTWSSRMESFLRTASADIYVPDFRAASAEAIPRAMKDC